MVPSAPSGAFTEPKVPVRLSFSQKVVLSALAVSNTSFLALTVCLKLARVPFFSIFCSPLNAKPTRVSHPAPLRIWARHIFEVLGSDHTRSWEEMHNHVAGTESHPSAQSLGSNLAFALGSVWRSREWDLRPYFQDPNSYSSMWMEIWMKNRKTQFPASKTYSGQSSTLHRNVCTRSHQVLGVPETDNSSWKWNHQQVWEHSL